MKKSFYSLIAILFIGLSISAQVELKEIDKHKIYVISTYDGAQFIGKIVSYDKSEVLILTAKLGEVAVPTYQLKEIKATKSSDIGVDGSYLKDNLFATRYFITTNGFDIKQGEHYVLLNWYGPDLQFGLGDNLTVGVMASWIGSPIIGSLKYSKQVSEDVSIAVGGLAGTLGWVDYKVGGALPFASVTLGNRKNNFTVSGGYGALWSDGFGSNWSGGALLSGAGMMRVTNAVSLVFDSFIIPGFSAERNFGALLVPGIRYQKRENFAIQFGFAGVVVESENYFDNTKEVSTFAIPMAQIFLKF